MHQIGIMQGRLTPSHGKGTQFFPFESWQEEFHKAQELKLNDIEFIFDVPQYEKNPLWTDTGVEEIKNLIKITGVSVHHICADFFMREPLGTNDISLRKKGLEIIEHLLEQTKKIGAESIEIPLLKEASVLDNKESLKNTTLAITHVLPRAEKLGITISLETDLPPKKLRDFVDSFQSTSIRVVYDTGNSASLGYSPEEEITILGSLLSSVQIKDRVLRGGTVPLGTGAVIFENVFQSLHTIRYAGNFILQAARKEDGGETTEISSQIAFVKKLIQKYLTIS